MNNQRRKELEKAMGKLSEARSILDTRIVKEIEDETRRLMIDITVELRSHEASINDIIEGDV